MMLKIQQCTFTLENVKCNNCIILVFKIKLHLTQSFICEKFSGSKLQDNLKISHQIETAVFLASRDLTNLKLL